MDKLEFDSVSDLVIVTIRDLYDITVKADFKKKIINVECFLFGEWKTVKLSVDKIVLYKNSAKKFIDYLKREMTKGLKEKLDE